MNSQSDLSKRKEFFEIIHNARKPKTQKLRKGSLGSTPFPVSEKPPSKRLKLPVMQSANSFEDSPENQYKVRSERDCHEAWKEEIEGFLTLNNEAEREVSMELEKGIPHGIIGQHELDSDFNFRCVSEMEQQH